MNEFKIENNRKKNFRDFELSTIATIYNGKVPSESKVMGLGGILNDGKNHLRESSEVKQAADISLFRVGQYINVEVKFNRHKQNEKIRNKKGFRNIRGWAQDGFKQVVNEGEYVSTFLLDAMCLPETAQEAVLSMVRTARKQDKPFALLMNFALRTPFASKPKQMKTYEAERNVNERLFSGPVGEMLRKELKATGGRGVWTGWQKELLDFCKQDSTTNVVPMKMITWIYTPSKNGNKHTAEIYTLDDVESFKAQMDKGEKLAPLCREAGIPYGSMYQAFKRHGVAVK